MCVLKVKVISLPYIFKVLYVLCFTRPRYQVSVYRTIGPLVLFNYTFYSRYNMEWIATCNTEIGLDPNNNVIKRLWCSINVQKNK